MPTLRQTATTLGALALASLIAPTAEAQGEALSAQEITRLHADQCISYWGPSQGTQCFTADGRTTYDDQSYGTDTGRWGLRGDEMCVDWDGEAGGFDCGPIWRVDAQTFTDGEYSWTID